jgi:RNA methyltransferase, rsmD family
MLRIIGGSRRGKNLLTLEGLDTRPTANRVREALFNIVGFDLPGASVLDLFSGSGALAIESLSRGAAKAVLCDANRQAAGIIRKNLSSCGFQAELFECDFRVCLNQLAVRGEPFDLVFLDPPYAMDREREEAIELIIGRHLLSQEGYIVVETEVNRDLSLDDRAEIFDTRRYGKTRLSFIRRRSVTEEEERI